MKSLFVSVQIGDGTSQNQRRTPVQVVGLGGGVVAIALGGVRLFITCACAVMII